MGWTKETFKEHWKEKKTFEFWNKDWKKELYRKEFKLVFPMLGKIKWDSLLEVGCGNGKNLEMIKDKYPSAELYGTDINIGFLQEAEKKGFRVDECDTEELKVAFVPDVILSWEHFQHLHPEAFKNAVEKIKASGVKYLILYEGYKKCKDNVIKAGAGGRWRHEYLDYFSGEHSIKKDYILMLAKL